MLLSLAALAYVGLAAYLAISMSMDSGSDHIGVLWLALPILLGWVAVTEATKQARSWFQ